jgi:hypothetical protein
MSFTYKILKDGTYEVTSYLYKPTNVYPPKDVFLTNRHLDAEGGLFIHSGFQWDGPSGPAIDTANFMRASCVHDCLYGMIKARKLDPSYRVDADREMRLTARADGMAPWRCWYAWLGVRIFGGFHV